MGSLLASDTDLVVRLAGTEVSEQARGAALADVSDLARDEAGSAGLAWDVASVETPVPPGVRVVVLDAARRRLLNPDAYVSETVGDYSYRRAEGAEGTSVFTDDELRVLRGYRSSGTGLGSLQIVRPGLYEASVDQYLPTNMEGDPLPWT